MWHLVRSRPFLTMAFALALLATVFFAARIIERALYWSDPAHQNQTVQGWMTVGYIAQSWDVDPADLDALAKLPMPDVKGHPQPLIEIATDRGVPVADVIAEVEAALVILAAQQKQGKAHSND